MLALCLCYTSDLGVGVGTILSTASISRALSSNVDQLSAEQRQARLDVASKLRKNAKLIAFLMFGSVVVIGWLVASPDYRQAGIPYYILIWQLLVLSQAAVRFRLIKAPTRARVSVAVSPAPPANLVRSQQVHTRAQSILANSSVSQPMEQTQSVTT